jgi:formylglycine-generating enzyme required for sulfatase activity
MDGTALMYQSNAMPARGQWWSACSNNGAEAYPYGNVYQKGKCNDSNTRVYPVGTYPDCQRAGIFDLSGNVEEWEASCSAYDNPPESDNCLRRGGAFWGDQAGLSCPAYREAIRGSGDLNMGFRCCSVP